jgi:hypothetical protein
MDRFVLEEEILKLHSVVDDLNDISYSINEDLLDQEDISYIVDGLAVKMQIKINKLFDVFKQTFGLDEYNSKCHCEFENITNPYDDETYQ